MSSTAWVGPAGRPAAHSLVAGLVLGSLLFVPGALGYLYGASSFASGTVVSGAGVLALVVAGRIPMRAAEFQAALALAAVASLVIVAHILLAMAIGGDPAVDLTRAMLSVVVLGAVAIAAPGVRGALMTRSDGLALPMKVICALFVLIALLSLAKIQPATESIGEKPTFPYTEPSFLGFSLPAVLLFTTVRSSLPLRVLWVVTFLGLAYALGNFTIIATCLLAAATVLPLPWLAAGIAATVIGGAGLDLTYYTDRLDIDWAHSVNLSALVYVQGWQMLQEALQKSLGWGIGFQQLGIVYTNVPASIRINALLGHDLNLQDGGFILSKVGSEFGLLGLALVSAYAYVAARSFLQVRAAATSRGVVSDGELFARCCVIGYAIELVVRGTNYFTGTFVLLIAGLLHLAAIRSSSRAGTVLPA